jgi:hypothetical protein
MGIHGIHHFQASMRDKNPLAEARDAGNLLCHMAPLVAQQRNHPCWLIHD